MSYKVGLVLIHPRIIDFHYWKPEGRWAVIQSSDNNDEPTLLKPIPCSGKYGCRDDATADAWRKAMECLQNEGVNLGSIHKLVWNEERQYYE